MVRARASWRLVSSRSRCLSCSTCMKLTTSSARTEDAIKPDFCRTSTLRVEPITWRPGFVTGAQPPRCRRRRIKKCCHRCHRVAWRGVAWRGVAWRGIDRQKYQNAAGGREGPARSSSERGAGRRGPAGAKTSFKITNKDDKETMDIKKIKCIYIFRFPLR